MEKFTTSRGVEVEFLSIATLLDAITASHPPPQPPVYEVQTATGAVEKHEHNVTTLETDADKAAWAQYLEAGRAQQRKLQAAITKVVLLRGMKAPPMPEGDGWVKEHEFLGMSVPDDPLERRLHWIETEVLAGQADVEAVMLGVMRASGTPEELLRQMEATFRRAPRRQAAGRADAAQGQVDGQPEVRAGQNGRQKRPHREPVRRVGSHGPRVSH